MTSPPAHGDGRTIFLIDSWPAFRRSLCLFVEAAGYRVVGEADTAEAAAGKRVSPAPTSSSSTLTTIGMRSPTTWRRSTASPAWRHCAAPSRAARAAIVAQTLHLGVCAYLTKNADPADLLNALAVAAVGRFVVLPQSMVLPRPGLEPAPKGDARC